MTRGKVDVHRPTPSTNATGRPPRRFIASVFGAGGGIGPAPDRVRLWNPGQNRWDGGMPIDLTIEAAARVMAAFIERGNPLSMDIEHTVSLAEARGATPAEAAQEGISAGYCALELVETPEGPALDFVPRWSDCGRAEALPPPAICCARHQIETGQRCEFSPDWLGDPATGEPVRVNRISLVRDGAMHGIGLLASRAAAERSRAMPGEMDGCRAAYAWHKAMAAAGGDDAKEHEAMLGKLKASAAALGVDLEGDEPKEPVAPPKEGEAAPRAAAEVPPPPKETEPPKGAVGAAALASRAAAAPLATADQVTAQVMRRLEDHAALTSLLEGNKDRMPDGHRAWLASQGLAAARKYVEGLPPRPAPPGAGGDTGGAVDPAAAKKRHRASLTEGERFLANRVHAALGKSEESGAAFDARPEVGTDDQGRAPYTFSIAEIAEKKRVQRLAAAGRA
jgi:hypothetical protein